MHTDKIERQEEADKESQRTREERESKRERDRERDRGRDQTIRGAGNAPKFNLGAYLGDYQEAYNCLTQNHTSFRYTGPFPALCQEQHDADQNSDEGKISHYGFAFF